MLFFAVFNTRTKTTYILTKCEKKKKGRKKPQASHNITKTRNIDHNSQKPNPACLIHHCVSVLCCAALHLRYVHMLH